MCLNTDLDQNFRLLFTTQRLCREQDIVVLVQAELALTRTGEG